MTFVRLYWPGDIAVALGLALEIDTALAFAERIPLGLVSEVDTALAITAVAPPPTGDITLLARFESSVTQDENTHWTNTAVTSGTPTQDTTIFKWGAAAIDINAVSTNEWAGWVAQGTDKFRAASNAATLDVWFYPVDDGTGGSSSPSTLRHAIVTMTTNGNAPALNPVDNIALYLWWHEGSGGTLGLQNSGQLVTGIAANTWHHVRLCWTAANGLQGWCDGARFINLTTGINQDVKGVYLGNQRTAGIALDGFAGSFLTKAKFDSLRIITGVATDTGATITVPTADFTP
jgi:hypothetical protein